MTLNAPVTTGAAAADDDRDQKVSNAVDFMLEHFIHQKGGEHQQPLFPRTIMTASTKGQVVVYSKEEMLAYFKAAKYRDCRINAFPHLVATGTTEYAGKNMLHQQPANFIFIDLDMRDFDDDIDKMTAAAERICQRIKEVFGDKVVPTVLWTGGGYHIYLPLSGNIIPEKYDVFSEFADWWRTHECKDLTSVFMAFAERFLTDGVSDKGHTPTTKSCLLRVPYTFNVKYDDEANQVLVLNSAYKCGEEVFTDVVAPVEMAAVQYILKDFRYFLFNHRAKLRLEEARKAKKAVADQRKYVKSLHIRARKMGMVVNKKVLLKQQQKKSGGSDAVNSINNTTTWWIERLLQIGIDDFRKRAVSLILVPYFLHKKRLSDEQIIDTIRNWLVNKCVPVKRLNFKPDQKIREAIHYSKQSKILHMKFETLKIQDPKLYRRIQELEPSTTTTTTTTTT
jgi:hypothetical protein